MNSANLEIPHIDQNTIECDIRAFTRWLNALADQVNWLSKTYIELKEQVEENTEDIRKLKIRVTNVENRLTDLENRVTNIENIIDNLNLDDIIGTIEMVNGRVDLLYSWLPIPYGMIDPKGWKFAMGTINVTSTTDAPTTVDGPGIYTSGAIEDDDVNFK